MTQLRRDAAYVRTNKRAPAQSAARSDDFDEQVYDLLSSPHTVVSATKTLASDDRQENDLEARVADSMLHLLQAERIELSPDS